jgi:EmrB/QacA subfamily drug resistance transporter
LPVTSAQSDDYTPDPNRWRGLAICLVAGFMTLLDVSIVNVALPSMQNGLHAVAADLSWVVSGYALTFGLALVPSGRLGDDHGRKRLFLIGLVAFTAMSVLCGVAQSATWLVVARLLQGAACGLLSPQVVGLIQVLFRGRERGRAFGLFGATVGISTAVGPLIGGLLLLWAGETDGWRWVFYVNVPIGVVALIGGLRLLPADEKVANRERRSLDLVGAALLGLGVVAVMLPLIEAEQGGANAHWWLLAVGGVLLVAFVLWERRYRARGKHPLINLALLNHTSFSVGTSLGTVYFAGFTGIFFVVTLFFQRGLHYTPLEAGASTLSFAIASAISAPIAGRLAYRYSHGLIVSGLVCVVLGLGASALLIRNWTSGHEWLVLLGPLALAGLGSGLVISPNQTSTLGEIPPAEGGTAAAILQTGQRIGTAIGTALAGSLFFDELTASRGNFHLATSQGLWGAVILVAVALVLGLVDLVLSVVKRRRAAAEPPAQPVAAPNGAGSNGHGHGNGTGSHGGLHGVVRADGRVVPGALVSLVDEAGNVASVVVTDAGGGYALGQVPAGRYTLVASGHLPVRAELRIDRAADVVHDVQLD